MAFQVSPGLNITELDLTAGVQSAALSVGAFVGMFEWGPAMTPVSVASESEMVTVFGKPDNTTYEYWFSAQAFLAYSNQLRVIRVLAGNALNATSEAKLLTGTVDVDVLQSASTVTGTGTAFTVELVKGQTIMLNNTLYTVANVVSNTEVTLDGALPVDITDSSMTAYGVLIKNSDAWEQTFSQGVTGYGLAAGKWPGRFGNGLRVSLCPSDEAFESAMSGDNISVSADSLIATGVATSFSTELVPGDLLVLMQGTREVETVKVASITSATSVVLASKPTYSGTYTSWKRRWEYAGVFDSAPKTSKYALEKGAVDDELHLVVVDETGVISGVRGTILERFAYASKASDAKGAEGSANYYATRMNRESQFVWWLSHVGVSTTSWGTPATSEKTYGADALPYSKSLVGAVDGNALITGADIQQGWDLFADADTTDVSLLITGPADPRTVGAYVVDNVAEVRKDAVTFLSPRKTSVVNNTFNEVADVLLDRGTINSSYAFMDSGWKYLYDKYNDVFRWVPLNGDIAGLAARTDSTNDPWWSPAGFTRGNVKNVVKLAWNPKQLQRDDLYKIGVNPVVSFPGQGVVLYGDKTLLTRPSAFDRVNVRRLFIALEKTIARYAKAQLFEFNDEFTRSAFRNAVEPFLRDVKARRGVSDFLVVCDSTNNPAQIVDSNQFVGDIFVKPTRAINFIQLNFVAVRTGVSFQEVIGAV